MRYKEDLIINSNDELKHMLERERIAKLICAELNNFVDLKSVLSTIINHIRTLSSCEAVSVRLRHKGDYPYYIHDGFPVSFIKCENNLCVTDESSPQIPSPEGNSYLLDCMCGKVICGSVDTSQPYFTQKGSFWCNTTSAFLASINNDGDNNPKMVGCSSHGYESVALIPIKAKNETIGLIQLNDKKRDLFTKELIETLEMITEQVGLAIKNSIIFIKQSTTDLLTNILNRRGILNAINMLAPLSKRNNYDIGIMMIDIDNFKRVNDTYGHQKGDYVLKKVAAIIKNSVRTSDVFGRYGGEEFLLFLSPVEVDALPKLAEKLCRSIENKTKDDLPVTVSIGVSNGVLKLGNKEEIDDLIKKADESLYQAKNSGRNQVVVCHS